MRTKFLLFLLLSLLLLSSKCYATTCGAFPVEKRMLRYPIIFKGKATSTKFEISVVYKGDSDEIHELIKKGGPRGDIEGIGLQVGHEYIVFTNSEMTTHYCNPPIDLGNGGDVQRNSQEIEELSKMKARLDEAEATAKSKDTEEAFVTYGRMLEEYRDYARAEKVYKNILKRQLQSAEQGGERWGKVSDVDTKNKCSSKLYSDHSPDFLKIPENGKLEVGLDALMRYSNALMLRDKYQNALLPLCIAAEGFGDKTAASWKMLTMQKLGVKEEIGSGPYDFSGRVIGELDVSGMNLSKWNFAGSTIQFIAKDTNFNGAIFDKSKISGKFTNSKFQDASFVGAKFNGNLVESTFDGAKFNGAGISVYRETAGNSFLKADFSGATIDFTQAKDNDFSGSNFSGAKINGLGEAKTTGANFTGAVFYTDRGGGVNRGIDLSNRNLENEKFLENILDNASFKGARLRKANFSGAKLKNADFRDADLTGAQFKAWQRSAADVSGADFSTAKIEGVDWEGAIFDCKTKFPSGFDPIANLMDTADTSCGIKQRRFAKYGKYRLDNGSINVCNGDYKASCVYSFMTQYALWMNAGPHTATKIKFMHDLAESLFATNETEISRLLALRALAEHAELYSGDNASNLDEKERAELIDLIHKIDEKHSKSGSIKNGKKTKVGTIDDDYIKSLNLSEQLDHGELRKDALKFLNDGDAKKARAIALYVLKQTMRYPDSSAKADLFLAYADILGRTEEKIDNDTVRELEPLIRHVPRVNLYWRYDNYSLGHTVPEDPKLDESVDYVSAGEKIFTSHQ